ncbi:MAG: Transcriptional regulator, TrmB [uncultured bacterium]|nr:MAG: Transcriptional regulator, TrmB [uncultured bacterium]
MDIQHTLMEFGLEEKEAQVYLGLSTHGVATALELSRHIPIKRATLYRILESLKQKGLVETQIDDKTTYYTASDPRQFELLILEQEKKVKSLRTSLHELTTHIHQSSRGKSGETTVRFFRGLRGLKQMEWRMCEYAKNNDLLIIGTSQWYEILGSDFAESIRDAMIHNNIVVYELIRNSDLEKIPTKSMPTWTKNSEYILHHFRHRELPKHILTPMQDFYVYNDTIQFHGYRENDIMGIEIQSRDFALMFKQIFWNYWKQAKIIDHFGSQIKKS